MTERNPTLSTVLGLDRGTPEERRISAAAARRLLERVPGEAAAAFAPGWRDAVADRVGMALGSALSIPLSTVLSSAWNQYRELLEYRDPERHPPGEFDLVPLREHTITSKHRPFIELYLGEARLCALEFGVEVEIELQGALLGIEGGKFRELRTGKSLVKAVVTCEGGTLLERGLGEYALPGVISFGAGIPIAPAIPVVGVRDSAAP